jgi:hypothetical protein
LNGTKYKWDLKTIADRHTGREKTHYGHGRDTEKQTDEASFGVDHNTRDFILSQ